jgi:SAM-dependent methyltransferase
LEDRHDHKQGVLEGLITSFRQQGFDAKNPISVTSELKLVDGSHRLACALYFNSNPVLTTRAASKAVDFGLDWFSKYFEPNELEVIKARYNELLQNIDIGRVLSETLVREKQVFGRGQFYQSSEELNITGQRPTSERYRIYGLKEFLDKDQSVLDIGCNCGFFTLKIAKEVKSAVGIEITGTLVSVAQTAQVYLQRPNVEFVKGNFNDHKFGKKFDFICSFAVHYWLGADMKKYGQRLLALLNPQGLVLLESQNIEKEDQDWEDKLSDFKSAGFVEIRSGTLKDDGVISRRFTVLRRN